jgi:hypothetical protein
MFAARQTPAPGGDALARLTWQDFEHLLAEHYRDQGYLVEHHAPADSLKVIGAALDLRLRRGSETVIVQCKHWDADEVTVQDINELLGNMLNAAATRGVFVTRGRYSAEARALMRRQPRLQLVDGDILRVMLKLPDHLDISLPDAANGRRARRGKADQAAGRPRRRGASDLSSRLGPALLVAVIAVLLGLFVWRAMSRQNNAAPVAPSNATAGNASHAGAVTSVTPGAGTATDLAPGAGAANGRPPDTGAPIGSTATGPLLTAPAAPAALPPLSGASGIVATTRNSLDPPSASRELAERERLRQQSEDSRNARKHEDGMKVLEQNTRELGSHD